MTIREKNLQVLKKRFPEIYVKYENRELEESNISAGAENIEGRMVLYAVRSDEDGDTVIQLDSMYDSEDMLRRWGEGVHALYNSKYIAFGFGNGMFVRQLLSQSQQESRILVYEPCDGIFDAVLDNFDITDILSDERVDFLFSSMETPDDNMYMRLSESLNYMDLDGLVTVTYINYEKLFATKHEYFMQKRQEVVRSIDANRTVLERFSKFYITNTFKNLPFMAYSRSLSNLWGYLPDDLTAIVVSSGPSLNKNINELKRAKGHALIFATDSSVNSLLNNDIIPDLMICVDANKNPKHFANPLSKEIPLVCSVQTAYRALEGHKADTFFLNNANPHIQKFMWKNSLDLPILSTGGSVANDAVSLMNLMGVKTVILVGQDLAYTGNKAHAAGSVREGAEFIDQRTVCYVEAIDGGEVLSSGEFNLYRRWLEEYVKQYPDIRVINATEGGAKIHNLEEMTLSAAIDECCQRDFDFASILPEVSHFLTKKQRKEFKEHIDELPERFLELDDIVVKGIRKYDEMLDMVIAGKHHNQRFQKLYADTQDTAKILEKSQYMYYPECYIQKEVGEMMNNAYRLAENEREELMTVLTQGRDYLELVRRGLTEAQRNVKPFLAENEEKYDMLKDISLAKEAHFEEEAAADIWEQVSGYINMVTKVDKFIDASHSLSERIDEARALKEAGLLAERIIKKLERTRSSMSAVVVMGMAFAYDISKDEAISERLSAYVDGNDTVSDDMAEAIKGYIKETKEDKGILFNKLLKIFYN